MKIKLDADLIECVRNGIMRKPDAALAQLIRDIYGPDGESNRITELQQGLSDVRDSKKNVPAFDDWLSVSQR